jgi:hypothetical protein
MYFNISFALAVSEVRTFFDQPRSVLKMEASFSARKQSKVERNQEVKKRKKKGI